MYPKFTKEMKYTHTILVPDMLPIHKELFKNVLEKSGYKIEDTILQSKFNKKILLDAAGIIDELLKLDFNPYKIDKRKKYAFFLSKEQKEKIEISSEPISISMFAYNINEQIDPHRMKKIKAEQITSWLMCKGYLEEYENDDGKKFKVLTSKSASIGITSKERTSIYGNTYPVNLYNENAQQFIIEHLEDITKTNVSLLKR